MAPGPGPMVAARRPARAVLIVGACIALQAWPVVVPGVAEGGSPSVREPVRRERPMSRDGRGPREPGWRERPPAGEARPPRATDFNRPGQVTREKVERWRSMSPDERERIRERYKRWKSLPPDRRERLMERSRRWRELPEGKRRFLDQRREIYRRAWPDEKRVIERFFGQWRQLPPERRRALRRRIAEWRDLPAAERDERLTAWPFYNGLRPEEQKVIRRFLFSEPPPRSLPPRE